jgi:CRP/FNR family transcriptional regulator, cyclic AMP receptor protein
MFRRSAPGLSTTPLTPAIPPAEGPEIARRSTRVIVPTGTELCREGRVGREAFVIVSGTATVSRRGKLIARLGPGDLFGEQALLGDGRRNATVVAITDLDLVVMSPREFASLLAVPGVAESVKQLHDERRGDGDGGASRAA